MLANHHPLLDWLNLLLAQAPWTLFHIGLVWPLEEIGLESWTLAGAPPQSSSSLVVCFFSLLSGGVAQFSLTDLKGMPSTPRDEASMAQMHEVAFRCVAICHCKHRIRVLYTYIYIYYATLLGVGFLSYS